MVAIIPLETFTFVKLSAIFSTLSCAKHSVKKSEKTSKKVGLFMADY
jgi:hypothetical protein